MTKSIYLIEGSRRGLHVSWVVVADGEGAAKEMIDYESTVIDNVSVLGVALDPTPRVVCREEP